MVKINLPTFKQAMDALAKLRQNAIPVSYWPNGGKTASAYIPITHNVAVNKADYARAKQLLEAL